MSRSLGTLTIDLIAKTSGFSEGLSQADRASDKWKKQVTKDAKIVGQSLLAVGAAGSAAAAAIVLSTAEISKEINQLSMLSGIGTEDFQKYAAGAKALGVENEKLADIFKDTSDKVGDFLQTEGGALADYFENIAPKVGQTAEQFRNLSGPQALELYVKGLQDANVSQNEMIFFMEAIASDATLLLPLLKDNASGFKLFGDEAEKAGAILDQKTITSAQELNATMYLLDQGSLGLKNKLGSGLIPVISDLSIVFYEASQSSHDFSVVSDSLNVIIKGSVATLTGAISAVHLFGKALGGSAAVMSAVPDGWAAVSDTFKIVKDDLESTADGYATAINKIWDAGSGEQANETVKNIAALQSAVETAKIEGETTNTYEEDQALLEEALNAKASAEKRHNECMLAKKAKFEETMTDIEEKESKARLRAKQSALGNLSTLMNGESRKLFEVGKAAALANAIISGHEAAVSSYAAGSKIGGPILGAAFAATALAATGVQIQAIQSASFGGGSSGAGGSATSAVNAATEQVKPSTESNERNIFIKGIGKDELFTGEQIVELLNNELVNGGRLAIDG